MPLTALPTISRPARRAARAGRVRLLVALVLLATVAASVPVLGSPASAAAALSPAEQDYLQRINQLRASKGLSILIVDSNLTDLARAHTQEMIDSRSLHHTPDLTADVTADWQKLGENVGFGPTAGPIFDAFVKSPHHLANLVDPTYTHVGVGVIVDGAGVQWTTHRFMALAGPPAPTTPPAPPTTPTTRRAVPSTTTAVASTTTPATSVAPSPTATPSTSAGQAGAVDAALEALHAL